MKENYHKFQDFDVPIDHMVLLNSSLAETPDDCLDMMRLHNTTQPHYIIHNYMTSACSVVSITGGLSVSSLLVPSDFSTVFLPSLGSGEASLLCLVLRTFQRFSVDKNPSEEYS